MIRKAARGLAAVAAVAVAGGFMVAAINASTPYWMALACAALLGSFLLPPEDDAEDRHPGR